MPPPPPHFDAGRPAALCRLWCRSAPDAASRMVQVLRGDVACIRQTAGEEPSATKALVTVGQVCEAVPLLYEPGLTPVSESYLMFRRLYLFLVLFCR